MEQPSTPPGRDSESSLQEQSEMREIGLLREFWEFLRTNKRWWLAPIIVSLLLFAVLVILSSQAAISPWIYSFF